MTFLGDDLPEAAPPVAEGPKADGRLPDGRFAPGNRLGGTRFGSRNKAALAAEALLDGEAEKLTRKAIKMALAGDGVALKLCFDRIIPVRRSRPVRLADCPAEPLPAMQAVAAALVDGSVTPDEAAAVISILQSVQQATAIEELRERMARLEERLRDETSG
jgi:hypothetical protein